MARHDATKTSRLASRTPSVTGAVAPIECSPGVYLQMVSYLIDHPIFFLTEIETRCIR
jgi:hypothetical protein